MDHLTSFKILKYSQSGLIKGWPCLANILDFLEEIYDKSNESKLVCYCAYLKDDSCIRPQNIFTHHQFNFTISKAGASLSPVCKYRQLLTFGHILQEKTQDLKLFETNAVIINYK